MTLTQIFSLFVAMIILAFIPGPGVFTVVARAIASGFTNGLATALGILCGDYIFIFLSLFGLTALAQSWSFLFAIIKYAGAGYLCWLGLSLFLTKQTNVNIKSITELSFTQNFIAGLMTTLSNPKAILFYVSFFPAFINVPAVTVVDIGILLIITTLSVGSVMVSYAYFASKSSNLFKNPTAAIRLNKTAGIIMMGTGAWLVLRAT